MIFCIKVGVVQSYVVSKFFLIRNDDEMLRTNMILTQSDTINGPLIKGKFVSL